MKDKLFSSKNTLNIKGKILDISVPKVMGVINVTPDSFFAGSRSQQQNKIVKKAEKMLDEGAAILDIGGYSTRPGAEELSEEEEANRVIPAIHSISRSFPDAAISIDSFRSNIVKQAFDVGASMINDVSGGNLDPEMFKTAAILNSPYILMHMRGTPQTMQKETEYNTLVVDIIDHLQKKMFELKQLGIADILIDPGFGFAKTVEQNYVLLKNLGYFEALELPIVVGLSRKSMISKTLGISMDEALNGTTVLNTLASVNGARILRVHDVKEAVEAVTLFNVYNL